MGKTVCSDRLAAEDPPFLALVHVDSDDVRVTISCDCLRVSLDSTTLVVVMCECSLYVLVWVELM